MDNILKFLTINKYLTTCIDSNGNNRVDIVINNLSCIIKLYFSYPCHIKENGYILENEGRINMEELEKNNNFNKEEEINTHYCRNITGFIGNDNNEIDLNINDVLVQFF